MSENKKVVLAYSGGLDTSFCVKYLTEEKGLDVYTKVEDSKCKTAQNFWATNKDVWAKVRGKWAIVFDNDKDLSLKKSVDGKPLYSHLFALKPDASQADVDKIIDSFIVK